MMTGDLVSRAASMIDWICSMLLTLNAPTPYPPLAASSRTCRIDTSGIYQFSFNWKILLPGNLHVSRFLTPHASMIVRNRATNGRSLFGPRRELRPSLRQAKEAAEKVRKPNVGQVDYLRAD